MWAYMLWNCLHVVTDHDRSLGQCCQQGAKDTGAEVTLHAKDVEGFEKIADSRFTRAQKELVSLNQSLHPYDSCKCLSKNAVDGGAMVESLSYMPVCFEEVSSLDYERSGDRYVNLFMHKYSPRDKKDWIRFAAPGHTCVVLTPFKNLGETEHSTWTRTPSFLLVTSDKLTIFPAGSFDPGEAGCDEENNFKSEIVISISRVEMACCASCILPLPDLGETTLDKAEQERAVYVQYMSECSIRKHMLFLEPSECAKDHLMQVLASLWQENLAEFGQHNLSL